VTILHLDRGRRLAGGQIQMRLLVDGLRARGVECGVESPLWREPAGVADLRHCHDAASHTWARKPFVVSRRVGFPVGRGWLSRWKYSRPEAFLAVSNYTARTLESIGVPRAKIAVVPDGVPPMPPADRSSGRVLLLSKNGITLPGAVQVADLREDLRDCDVFVYLSDMEGLGSAALVAQAAGVPVVASRVGGLPEAVGYGLLVDNDPAEVAAAIEQARDMDASDAPAWVQARFSVDAMVDRTIDVYRKVLGC
jgi:glycosyltransferase involved in cell wall biosynthesis